MIQLKDTDLAKFRTMFNYIPAKTFPSILLIVGKKKSGTPYIRISDVDINMSLVVSMEMLLTEVDGATIEAEESYRVPLSKSVMSVISNFEEVILDKGTIKGVSGKKEVQVAMYINEDDVVKFPVTLPKMLEFTKDANGVDDIMEAKIDITREILEDFKTCFSVLDGDKKDEKLFNFSISSKTKSIVINSKDNIGNTFKYTLDDIETTDTFKVKYDDYFLRIMNVLLGIKEVDSFTCSISNIMFCTDFIIDDVKILLALTVFEKI